MGRIPKLKQSDFAPQPKASGSLLSRLTPLPLAARIDAIPEEEDVIMTSFEDHHKILSSRKKGKTPSRTRR
jgi:hypothetical protein